MVDHTESINGDRRPVNAEMVRRRVELAREQRAHGVNYPEIAGSLGISMVQVEAILGEVAQLRRDGHTFRDVALVIGTSAASARRLAGEVRSGLSAQQSAALAGVSEMFGMQVDILAAYLDTSTQYAYQIANTLHRCGYLHPLSQATVGKAWVYPKRDVAARYLGWLPVDWAPDHGNTGYLRAAAQARTILGANTNGRWVPERVMRHERDAQRRARRQPVTPQELYPYAGRLRQDNGGWVAVKVEAATYPKSLARLADEMADTVRTAVSDGCVELLCYCVGPNRPEMLERAWGQLRPELTTRIRTFGVGDVNDEWADWWARKPPRKRQRGGLCAISDSTRQGIDR